MWVIVHSSSHVSRSANLVLTELVVPLFDLEATHLVARCKTLFKRSKKVPWVRLFLPNECHIVGRDLYLG